MSPDFREAVAHLASNLNGSTVIKSFLEEDYSLVLAFEGPVPDEVKRSLFPGCRPPIKPPTADEKKALVHLCLGPLSGPDWAASLGMEHDGGGFKRLTHALMTRGFIFHSAKVGYQLNDIGTWALTQ